MSYRNMRDVKRLLQYGRPGEIGFVTQSEWESVERRTGPLPGDFKQIVSYFGLGSFGEIVPFNPYCEDVERRLPDAVDISRDYVRRYSLESSAYPLLDFPLVLGFVHDRRYLMSGSKSWAIYDTESEELSQIGEDLIAFLEDAYLSLTEPSPLTPIAQSIWNWSYDGKTRAPFFQGVRAGKPRSTKPTTMG